MSNAMPVYTFTPGITEKELLKVEQESKTSISKIFQPGDYTLKIVEFAHGISARNPSGTARRDPSWRNYKIVLGGLDTRTIYSNILIPTRDLIFGSKSDKYHALPATNLRKFFRALGLPTDVEKIGDVVQGLLANPAILVGAEVAVVIGYKKPYIKYNPELRTFFLVSAKGAELFPGQSFTDRPSAEAEAAANEIERQSFPEVLRYTPKGDEAAAIATDLDSWT